MSNKLTYQSILLALILFGHASFAQKVSFQQYQNLIFFKVKVNQEDSLLFLMDTGANVSVIDSALSDSLGLVTVKMDTVEGSAGNIYVPLVKVHYIAVAGKSVNGLDITKQDMRAAFCPPGQRLYGILGTDFLKHFNVELDFNQKTIAFSEKPKKINKGTRYCSFEMDNGIPRIKVLINNKVNAYLRYDSGASLFATDEVYINITSAMWDELKAADTSLKPYEHLTATGTGGQLDMAVVKVNKVTANDFLSLANPNLIVQPRQGYFARQDAVGFFSNNLVQTMGRVDIDFLSGNIVLAN